MSEDIHTLHELGISTETYAAYMVLLTVATSLVWMVVGWLIFWHRSDDGMALFVALLLVTYGASGASGGALAFVHPTWTLPVKLVSLLGDLSIGLLFYLFPTGRFVPRWTRWLAMVYIIYEILSLVSPPDSPINASWLGGVIFLLFLGIGLYALIYRYRRASTTVQRQQTKWVVFGLSMAGMGFIVLFVPSLISPALIQPGSIYGFIISTGVIVLVLPIPLSFGMAILRSHLWDIDRLINRTLVYGMLTVLLALLYFGLIFALQSLLQGLFKQNNSFAIVVSTLIIAALFQPLRRRIQAIIDRRFYRRKYDAAKTLEAFRATLRNEVDLNQLREHLLNVVQETMQPAHVSLWLRQSEHDGKHQTPWRVNPPVDSQEG